MPKIYKEDADDLAHQWAEHLSFPEELMEIYRRHIARIVSIHLRKCLNSSIPYVDKEGITFLQDESCEPIFQCSWDEIVDAAVQHVSDRFDWHSGHPKYDPAANKDTEAALAAMLDALRTVTGRIEAQCRRFMPLP